MRNCVCKPKLSTRGRREIKPLFVGPIPENESYRAMVMAILKDKRRRDIIQAYRELPANASTDAANQQD